MQAELPLGCVRRSLVLLLGQRACNLERAFKEFASV